MIATLSGGKNNARADRFLRYTLDSGSARVFNCLRHSTKMLEEDASESKSDTKLLFTNREMNDVIFIKEATQHIDAISQAPGSYSINTKLYFPYDKNNIYSGGQSIFFRDSNFFDVLRAHIGKEEYLRSETDMRDRKILEILSSIPTLDPFLVRDKMMKEDINCDDRYFTIPAEEWKEIQVHIRAKIEPMVLLALPDAKARSRDQINFFIDKIWHADDLDQLKPLIQAFKLPVERTEEIFYAWKGLAYYEFQYARSQERIRRMAEWLKNASDPLDYVKPSDKPALIEVRESVKGKIKTGWSKASRVFNEYSRSYDELFVNKGSAGPFVQFMSMAPTYFWSLGDIITRIYQTVEVWDKLTHRYPSRRLKFVPLMELYGVMEDIMH